MAAPRAARRTTTPAASSTAVSGRWSSTVGVLIALAALNIAIYAAVRSFAFTNWDDADYVLENLQVQAGLSWSNVWWALTTGHPPYWHPLTWLSHMADMSLYGFVPGPHHVTNVILHVVNTSLVFVFFRQTTARFGRSLFVAAVFAAHPLHVESVAWIAERKDVLSGGFMLLTLVAYAAYTKRPRAAGYALVVGLFACALMSKPMAVTLPVVLLLCDVWPLQRLTLVAPDTAAWRRAIVEKLPLLALSLAASAVTILVQDRVGAMAGINVLDGSARLSNAIVGYVGYLGSAIWPARLAAFYPMHPWTLSITIAALALLVALTWSAWRVRARYPFAIVGWLWFLVMLLPVSGLLQAGEQARADRFMYLPMLGLLIVAAWGIVAVAERASWPTRPLAVVGAAVVVALAVVAHAQVPVWANSLSLWQHATRVAPSYLAFEKLGQAERDSKQWAAARASYGTAATLAPREWTAYHAILRNAMGMVELEAGDLPAAARLFGEARALNPALVEARINLGNALAGSGQAAAAESEFREAARLDPSLAEPRIGLAAAVFDQGRTTEAVTLFADAARAFPDVAEAHIGLGSALARSGRLDEAIAAYRQALQRNPNLASGHLNLGITLAQRGDLTGAVQELEAALRIDPGLEPARRALDAIRR